MSVIGIATRDFRASYELMEALKRRKTPFMTLEPKEPVPKEVGVLVTTPEEAQGLDFPKKVVLDGYDGASIRKALAEALRELSGKQIYGQLVIGIDPGNFPGVAVVADGAVIETHDAKDPAGVAAFVTEVIDKYPFLDARIRIGHGDPMNRNLIINAVLDLGLPVEITDETSTSNAPGITHTDSAAEIAQMEGHQTAAEMRLEPSRGLIRDIQRKSRLSSGGELTISQELAASVARGELTMEEAVERQRERPGGEGEGE